VKSWIDPFNGVETVGYEHGSAPGAVHLWAWFDWNKRRCGIVLPQEGVATRFRANRLNFLWAVATGETPFCVRKGMLAHKVFGLEKPWPMEWVILPRIDCQRKRRNVHQFCRLRRGDMRPREIQWSEDWNEQL